MLDVLKQQINTLNSHTHKINRTRELLQIIILYHLSNEWFFEHHCFIGWTALRICYGLQRYSEDLDFSVKEHDQYDYLKIINTLEITLKQYGFDIENTVKEWVIFGRTIKFNHLLYDLWLSGHFDQKLQIKCEIDTEAPEWAERETKIINELFIFPIHAHTLPSLFAWKVHAILQRWFTKGRDRFDLIWYLSKWVTPNYFLLNNALKQTESDLIINDRNTLIILLTHKLWEFTKQDLLNDVGIFLQSDDQRKLMDVELIRALINSSTQT